MNFKFEELQITVNGQKFLVDGELELERDPFDKEAIAYGCYSINRVFNINSEKDVNLCFGEWRMVETAISVEFYKSNSTLYNDALAFWEDMQ